jgi:hypothetical protein
MKMVWLGLMLGSAAFAQSDPNNAAAESLKRRILGMNLLNPPSHFVLPTPAPVSAAAPTVCSIPLINVVPPGTADKMQVQSPKMPSIAGDYVKVPAPPCTKQP